MIHLCVVPIHLPLICASACQRPTPAHQMVMFRHGRGMTEEQVRAVVLQTLDQRDKVGRSHAHTQADDAASGRAHSNVHTYIHD